MPQPLGGVTNGIDTKGSETVSIPARTSIRDVAHDASPFSRHFQEQSVMISRGSINSIPQRFRYCTDIVKSCSKAWRELNL